MIEGKHVAIAWLSEEGYRLMRYQLLDGDEMPRDYADWLTGALEREAALKKAGNTVLRVPLDDGKFAEFCKDLRLPMDRQRGHSFADRILSRQLSGLTSWDIAGIPRA